MSQQLRTRERGAIGNILSQRPLVRALARRTLWAGWAYVQPGKELASA